MGTAKQEKILRSRDVLKFKPSGLIKSFCRSAVLRGIEVRYMILLAGVSIGKELLHQHMQTCFFFFFFLLKKKNQKITVKEGKETEYIVASPSIGIEAEEVKVFLE
jgi:hypothetical protein